MPRIATLGATGKLGERLVSASLEQGYDRIARAELARFVVGMPGWAEWHRAEMTVGSK